ncbi:MAG TPA: hypothetical protein C5S51_01805 [Methanosarcinaceae archaeon]|nr:hypothetical protein [Methanosarcinaceae archaeon]
MSITIRYIDDLVTMGTITINVNDDVEKMSREIAKNELKLLDKGFRMGRISVTREEVHER